VKSFFAIFSKKPVASLSKLEVLPASEIFLGDRTTSAIDQLTEEEEKHNEQNLHRLRLRTFYAFFRFRDYLAASDEAIRNLEIESFDKEIAEALDFYEKITDEFYKCSALHCLADIFIYSGNRHAAQLAISNITIDFIKENATADFVAGREVVEKHFVAVTSS
jgi:hypothetical protein